MRWAWEPDLLAAGHAAGLRALGRGPLPGLTARSRRSPCRGCCGRRPSRRSTTRPCAEALAEAGVAIDDSELGLFLEAEHDAWRPARLLASTTHALLDALREQGLSSASSQRARPAGASAPGSGAPRRGGAARRRRLLLRGRLAQAASRDLRAGADGARRRGGGHALRRGYAGGRHRRRGARSACAPARPCGSAPTRMRAPRSRTSSRSRRWTS